MERVELALVEDVRADVLDLAGIDQPDLIAVSAGRRRPAEHTGIVRERGRRRRRHDVEAEGRAPRGGGGAEVGANARVERVRRARDPRQRQVRRGDGARQRRVVVEDAVVAEGVARRHLELVRARAGNGGPGKGRGAAEGRSRRLVRAQQEAVQPGRRLERGRRGRRGGRENGKGKQRCNAEGTHGHPSNSAYAEPRPSLKRGMRAAIRLPERARRRPGAR